MLITYADSMGKDLRELEELLSRYFDGLIGAVHILPFFPSSADRGFAPLRYDVVDAAFGTMEDIRRIGQKHPLMFDFMVNHISAQSEYYRDFLRNKDMSPYAGMFIRYKDFWPGGAPTQAQVGKIYKRKPRAPYVEACFADGTTEKVWCTFSEEQIDLNVTSPVTRKFMRDTLTAMCENGAQLIRLDAFAYAVKKPGTSCFFVEPEMWNLLEEIKQTVQLYGVDILPEIHEHYTIQLKLAQKGYWVYDFALPMLVLHALYSGDARKLVRWLSMCPRKQFTTLDTHDGIGVVDVADLLTPDEIERTRDALYEKGANVKRKYSSAEYNNLDIYQINCTYYSALGNDDQAYLLARAIQFFAPGIPQVYYVGLLAGQNDVELMERTRQGRDINRHYYTKEEVGKNMQRPVVQKMCELMRLRNTHPAFSGDCAAQEMADGTLKIVRTNGPHRATLTADLTARHFTITATDSQGIEEVLTL